MKLFRFFSSSLLVCLVCATLSPASTTINYHSVSAQGILNTIVPKPTDGGIRENIPAKYKARYEKWKNELLATDFGKEQWESYANNKGFVLVITITDNQQKNGAGTAEYQWTEEGELVGATISLGKYLEKGYPNPIYFPVMNSLSIESAEFDIDGNILAATKFAHEFGHVNLTAKSSGVVVQRQNTLMPTYNQILLSNGYNITDKKLTDLATEMGGTPVEIWENREYWGEANAMQFLLGRINKEKFYCPIFNRIMTNIKSYARNYEDRFDQIADAKTTGVCHD
jgi:hypothetical protein